MKTEFVILIADRNRHVREFLRRELTAEGFRVQVVKDGREMLAVVTSSTPPDLLVIDLDIPYVDDLSILAKLHDRTPPLPIVIHTFLNESSGLLNGQEKLVLVEKNGNTDCLKKAVIDMLKKYYPQRFTADEAGSNPSSQE